MAEDWELKSLERELGRQIKELDRRTDALEKGNRTREERWWWWVVRIWWTLLVAGVTTSIVLAAVTHHSH